MKWARHSSFQYGLEMKDRIVNTTIDRDNNIVVTIRKYGWSTCVFHSFWSIAFFISIAGVLFLFVKQQWVTVIVFLIFTVLMWVKTWLHSNDKL